MRVASSLRVLNHQSLDRITDSVPDSRFNIVTVMNNEQLILQVVCLHLHRLKMLLHSCNQVEHLFQGLIMVFQPLSMTLQAVVSFLQVLIVGNEDHLCLLLKLGYKFTETTHILLQDMMAHF